MTRRTSAPKLTHIPRAVMGPALVKKILLGLAPKDSLVTFDFDAAAERYVDLTASYLKDRHSPNLGSRDLDGAWRNLTATANNFHVALASAQGPLVEAYNLAREDGDPTLGEAAHLVEELLAVLKRVQPERRAKESRGRDCNQTVRVIVAQIAEDFTSITEAKATRSDGFIALVKDLFNEMGVSENAEYFTREVLEE